MILLKRLMAGTATLTSALALMAVAPAALAHSQWLLPSATQVEASTNPQRPTYVTVDAAVSNTLFFADHVAMRLTAIQIVAPDGSVIQPENPSTGKLRSTFDVKLDAEGTYRIASVSQSVMAAWKDGTEIKTFRGSEADFAAQVPANAPELKVSRNSGRVETFVTAGKPSAIKPVGKGLELLPLQPTTDLVVGDKAKFRVLLDGKAQPGLKVKVTPGGVRYRGDLEDQTVAADANGDIAIDWKFGGVYYLSTSYPLREEDDDHGPQPGGAPAGGPQPGAAGPQAGGQQAGPGARAGMSMANMPPVRSSYALTVEVLPF